MITETAIDEWQKFAPWALKNQIEQDLIISRALIEIFNNDYLKDKIAFRGGTALNKLIFPKPLRYSEDIDLNRLEKGPAKIVIDEMRNSLNEMLGQPKKVLSTHRSIKVIYHYQSRDGGTSKLKVEINVCETLPQKNLNPIPYEMSSIYFQGRTTVMAFNTEEMIGSKIRALYQRSKGRDLFDLYESRNLSINWDQVVSSFQKLNVCTSAKELEKNVELKMKDAEFLKDIIPLLPIGVAYNADDAYQWFIQELVLRFKKISKKIVSK